MRPDILHACDIAEEVGIGYGFNNIPMVYPQTNTVGGFIPENKFTDLLRHEIAQAGYIESLTCALVSTKENYNFLRQEPNLNEAVTLSNPKMLDGVRVEVYGQKMPISQLATVSIPEPQMINVQVWDKANVSAVDQAIRTSDLNLNPLVDGQLLRIAIPKLTEERRKELIKVLKTILFNKVCNICGKKFEVI